MSQARRFHCPRVERVDIIGPIPYPRPRDTLTSHITIAIDGPVASGKTTVGRIVAQQLGLQIPRHRLDVPGGRTCRVCAPGSTFTTMTR